MAPFTPSSTAPCLAFDANTVVVITGTSRGLGLHLVSYILETTRSQVVATARNIDKAAQLRELAAKFEGRAMLVELDTEDPASVKAAAAEVAKTHGGIDLLFNNAAILDAVTVSPLELTPEQYEKILKVNVVGPFLTTNAFLPLLRNKQSRVVVNMSSGLGSIAGNRQGKIAIPDGTPMNNKMMGYTSSKAALNMQSSVFANLLKDEGFTFLALCPGWTDTDMGAGTAKKLGLKAAPLTVETSVRQQLQILKALTPDNNGDFVNYEGRIDW